VSVEKCLFFKSFVFILLLVLLVKLLVFLFDGAKVLLFFDMTKLFWKKMQKKFILVYFVKSGPQNDIDSNKIIIIFIKK
jgi:hypothetical protein